MGAMSGMTERDYVPPAGFGWNTWANAEMLMRTRARQERERELAAISREGMECIEGALWGVSEAKGKKGRPKPKPKPKGGYLP